MPLDCIHNFKPEQERNISDSQFQTNRFALIERHFDGSGIRATIIDAQLQLKYTILPK